MIAWGRILSGYRPFLSLEITKECPLHCPGCYAYAPEHLGGETLLRQLTDYKGDELVRRAVAMVKELRPLHVSIIGGEPLVRYREVGEILKQLEDLVIRVQVVTSAVRPIPAEWAKIRNLQLVVSIDGLQPEHDERRTPATYERILQHIKGQTITVHCTITRQFARRAGYLEEFTAFWTSREEVRNIWFSTYTPQAGEVTEERLQPEDRAAAVKEVRRLRNKYRQVDATNGMLDAFEKPPQSPDECIFARTTNCFSADFTTKVTPCQLGGKPVCEECGCVASVGLAALGRHKLGGLVPLDNIFAASFKIGENFRRRREKSEGVKAARKNPGGYVQVDVATRPSGPGGD